MLTRLPVLIVILLAIPPIAHRVHCEPCFPTGYGPNLGSLSANYDITYIYDELGRLPMQIQSGQVVWFEEDVGSLIGRAEIANIASAIASSFSCIQGCQCPPSYASSYVNPCPMPMTVVGETMSCQAFEMRSDCNNVSYGPYNRTTDATWNSSNTAVATAAYGGSVSCVGVGSTSVYAQFSATIYSLNCFVNTINPSASCNMEVRLPLLTGAMSPLVSGDKIERRTQMKAILLLFCVGTLFFAALPGPSAGQSAEELVKQYLPHHAKVQSIKSYDPATNSAAKLQTALIGHLGNGSGNFLAFVYTPQGSEDLMLRVVVNAKGQASIIDKKLPGTFLWMQNNLTNGLQVVDINGDGADEVITITAEGASVGGYLEIFSVAPGKLTNLVQGRYEAIGGYQFDLERQPEGKYRIIAHGKWTDPDNSTIDAYAWSGTKYIQDNRGIQDYYAVHTTKLLQEIYSNQPMPAPQRANVLWRGVPLYLRQHRYQESIKVCKDVNILRNPALVTIPQSAVNQAITAEQKQRVKAEWAANGLEAQALAHRLLGDSYKAAGDQAHADTHYSEDERLRAQAKSIRGTA